jgi:predicted GIY-YIG superfamily endonuclease
MRKSEAKDQIRDTYKYLIHTSFLNEPLRGCTNDLTRRLAEHKIRYPDATLEQVGNKVTRINALKWMKNEKKRS